MAPLSAPSSHSASRARRSTQYQQPGGWADDRSDCESSSGDVFASTRPQGLAAWRTCVFSAESLLFTESGTDLKRVFSLLFYKSHCFVFLPLSSGHRMLYYARGHLRRLAIMPQAPNMPAASHLSCHLQSQRQTLHVTAFTLFKHNTSVQSVGKKKRKIKKQQNVSRNCKVNHQQVFNVVLGADVSQRKKNNHTKWWALESVSWVIFCSQMSRPKTHSSVWVCAVEKHDWYSTITTPIWSCYRFWPCLKSSIPAESNTPTPPTPPPSGVFLI